MIVHDGDSADTFGKRRVYAIEAILDEVASFDCEDGSGLVMPVSLIDIRCAESFGQPSFLSERFQLGELPLIVRKRLAGLEVTIRVYSGRCNLEQAQVGDCGKQSGAYISSLQLGDGALFKRLTECAYRRRSGWQAGQEEPPRMTVNIGGGVTLQECNARRSLLIA